MRMTSFVYQIKNARGGHSEREMQKAIGYVDLELEKRGPSVMRTTGKGIVVISGRGNTKYVTASLTAGRHL